MNNIMIYIFGKPGTGKTILSDEIEQEISSREKLDMIPVGDSNLEKIISSLGKFKNTLLIIQSNMLTKSQVKALKGFIDQPGFVRGVVIQSELKPDKDIIKYFDQVYETGLPFFSWVSQVGGKWKAKAIKTGDIWIRKERDQAIELARDYK